MLIKMFLAKCCLVVLSYCAVVLKAEDQADVECGSVHFKCLTSKKCIPLSWRCDSDTDCGDGDGSDEENCPKKSCANGEFNCPGSGQCIAERWKCDGEVDCKPNGEDEDPKTCANTTRSCETGSLLCNDGSCVDPKWICDGVDDCTDGLDEKNCTRVCGADMHTCSDGQCISRSWVCDGDHDCLNKSDEINCDDKVCNNNQFKCDDSSRCIDVKWRCDNDFDCPDHSDETNNCSLTARESEVCSPKTDFQCKTSLECIHKSWQCDGEPDCTDLSDEGAVCNFTCREDQFLCGNHTCILKLLVCDGNDDCLDSADEIECNIKNRNPCRHHECPNNSHCERDAFANKSIVANCTCERGFEWFEEAGHCKDIDECQHRDSCSQICINTKGGYKCECQPGYTIEGNYHCIADGEPVWLYYANRRDIRRLRADSRYSEILVENTENSIALDFDYKNGLMFWTDTGLEKIMSAKVNGDAVPANDIKTVIVRNPDGSAFSPDGLAVDWIYENIYWTDTGSNRIKVSNYDGSKVKTLIDIELDEPRAICVDPENGYVYWTDWGKDPKIERCGMDGDNRETIVSGGEHLEWPNGLTIDYVGKRIYWIDSKLHKIGTANLDGSDKGHVLVDATVVRRPFSIAVFEDSLYWTDWSTNSIKSVHKVTGRDRKTLSIGSYSVMDIKVYHELRQESGFKDQATKLCESAQCEYLCLPTARILSNATVSCVCADGQNLNVDKRTCTNFQVTVMTTFTSLKHALMTNKLSTIKPSVITKKAGIVVKPSTTLEATTTEGKTTTTGEPVTTEGVTTTEKPVTIEGVHVTTTEKSATTEGVTTTEKPATIKEVTNTEKLATTEEVTTTEKPVTTEGVTTTEKPATIEEVTNTEKLATTEEVTTTEKPVTIVGVTTREKSPTTEGVTTSEKSSTPAPSITDETTDDLKIGAELPCHSSAAVHANTKNDYYEEERVSNSEMRLDGKSRTSLQFQLLHTEIYRSLLGQRKLKLEIENLEEKRNQELSLFEQRRRNGQALLKAKLMLFNLKMKNERKKLNKEDRSN